MRNILVTAIGGNVGNGILKCLENKKNNLFGCNTYDYPVGYDRVKEFFISRPAIDTNYVEDIIEKCNRYNITHFIPVNEAEISVINKNMQIFNENNIKVLINSANVLKVCMDKYKTSEFLLKNNIMAPKTYNCEEFKFDGKEYIVKLRNSSGSRLLKRIFCERDIENIEVSKEDIIIQEFIGGEDNEYTVGVFSNGVNVTTIIFRRVLENGYTKFVELIDDINIENDTIKIATLFQLKGAINIQLKKYNDKNYIFEINPRISGTACFRHLLGFKDCTWWLDMLDGNEKFLYERKYKKAIGIRELQEKFLLLEYPNNSGGGYLSNKYNKVATLDKYFKVAS